MANFVEKLDYFRNIILAATFSNFEAILTIRTEFSSVQILIYSNKPTTFKMFSIFAISALLAVASADTGYLPAPAPAPYLAPQPYAFTYGVSDSYSGSEYAAQAADDGKVVTGSYSVSISSFRFHIT